MDQTHTGRDLDYAFIIRRLQPPMGITHCLRIAIPETSLLNDKGDVELTVMCSRVWTYKYNYRKTVLNTYISIRLWSRR